MLSNAAVFGHGVDRWTQTIKLVFRVNIRSSDAQLLLHAVALTASIKAAVIVQFYQGHLGIYYYVETRSYGMFGPRAPTFLVLGCRSAGK